MVHFPNGQTQSQPPNSACVSQGGGRAPPITVYRCSTEAQLEAKETCALIEDANIHRGDFQSTSPRAAPTLGFAKSLQFFSQILKAMSYANRKDFYNNTLASDRSHKYGSNLTSGQLTAHSRTPLNTARIDSKLPESRVLVGTVAKGRDASSLHPYHHLRRRVRGCFFSQGSLIKML